jgi:hypothetical protein
MSSDDDYVPIESKGIACTYDVESLSIAKSSYLAANTVYSLEESLASENIVTLGAAFREKFGKLFRELEEEFAVSKDLLVIVDREVSSLVKRVLQEEKNDENSKFFWQREFSKGRRLTDLVQRADKLYRLGVDMTTMCSKYSEVIIMENFELGSERTIQPVDVGGVAGGDKFIIR